MVMPSGAVTMADMVLAPVFNVIVADGLPDVMAVPLTVTVDVGSLVVGVTVMDVVALGTLTV